MSILKINELRKEKIDLIAKCRQAIEDIRNDERLSDSFRNEKLEKAKSDMESVRQGHDERISKLIDEGKKEARQKILGAEFTGLKTEDLLQMLLIDNRNKDVTSRAIVEYGSNPDLLLDKIKEEVENNSIYAKGYINAYYQISDDPVRLTSVKELEREHKNNNLNALQVDYGKVLQAYLEAEREYREDLSSEAFTQRIDKYK